MDKIGSFYPVTRYSLVIALGGLVFGYDIGTIGGLIDCPSFVGRYGDTLIGGRHAFLDITKGVLVGIACLGACAGSLLAKVLGNRFGMRWAFFVACCGYLVGDIFVLTAPTWQYVVWGRFVIGNANGIVCTICPMFISDLAPLCQRGIYVSFQQLFTTIGILLGGVTMYYSVNHFDDNELGQFQYGVYQSGIMALVAGCLIWTVPESPVWLGKQGDINGASLSFSRARCLPVNSESININVMSVCEMKTTTGQDDHEKPSRTKSTSLVHGQPHYLQRTFAGVALFFFQQFTGINYFFFYGTTIFSKAGLSSAYVAPMILASVNLVFSLLSIFTVSKFERRTLLTFGSVCMVVLMISFSSFGVTIPDTPVGTALMITSACGFIGAFAMTWGPITQILVSEMYPSTIKVKAMSVCGTCNWVFNFTISVFVPVISRGLGFGLGFVFVASLVGSIFFVRYGLPETKDKTSQQIEKMYGHKEDKGQEEES